MAPWPQCNINEEQTMEDRDNVGVKDTAIRSIIACVLLALAVEQIFATPITIAMVVIGTALWISCASGVCLIYKMLGIDTYHLKYD